MEVMPGIDLKDDDALLRLARRVANMAEEDGSSEFHDIRWAVEILEKNDSEVRKLSYGSVSKAFYIRLALAEARLLGRRARVNDKGEEACNVPAVVADLEEFQGVLRRAWMDGFQSINLPIMVSASIPSDELKLVKAECLSVRYMSAFRARLVTLSSQFPEFESSVRLALVDKAIEHARRGKRPKSSLAVHVPAGVDHPSAEVIYSIEGDSVVASRLIVHDLKLQLEE